MMMNVINFDAEISECLTESSFASCQPFTYWSSEGDDSRDDNDLYTRTLVSSRPHLILAVTLCI